MSENTNSSENIIPRLCPNCRAPIDELAKRCPSCFSDLTKWSLIIKIIKIGSSLATTGALFVLICATYQTKTAIDLQKDYIESLDSSLALTRGQMALQDSANELTRQQIFQSEKDRSQKTREYIDQRKPWLVLLRTDSSLKSGKPIFHFNIRNDGKAEASSISKTITFFDTKYKPLGWDQMQIEDLFSSNKKTVTENCRFSKMDTLLMLIHLEWSWREYDKNYSNDLYRIAIFDSLSNKYSVQEIPANEWDEFRKTHTE